MTDTKTTATLKFDTEELQFLNSLLLFSLNQLEAKKSESHSGVDVLLYNTWIQETRKASEKFGGATVSLIQVQAVSEASVEG